MGAKPPYGYTGHRYESELGLTDAGGRFYDAKFGIFLSPDPIGPLNGGSTFGNRYSYAGYDPINFVDPTGFAPSGVDCLNTENFTAPECREEAAAAGGGALVLAGAAICLATDCLGGDGGGEGTGIGGEDGGVAPIPLDQEADGDPSFSNPSTTASPSTAKPRIFNTADAQLFGVAGTTHLPSSSELLVDYYTPQGTMVTCSVAGPGCSDGSGYVFGWTGNAYTQQGRELGSVLGTLVGELSGMRTVGTPFDSNAAMGDRLWAGGEIGFAVAGGNVVRGGARLVGALGRFARFARGVTAFEVGAYDALRARSVVGDALDLHHVGQAHAMEQIVPGYSRAMAPAIALPEAEHAAIPTLRGTVDMSPRSLLARDIWNLRQYTNAPNSSLRQLIDMNKTMYPEAFAP